MSVESILFCFRYPLEIFLFQALFLYFLKRENIPLMKNPNLIIYLENKVEASLIPTLNLLSYLEDRGETSLIQTFSLNIYLEVRRQSSLFQSFRLIIDLENRGETSDIQTLFWNSCKNVPACCFRSKVSIFCTLHYNNLSFLPY